MAARGGWPSPSGLPGSGRSPRRFPRPTGYQREDAADPVLPQGGRKRAHGRDAGPFRERPPSPEASRRRRSARAVTGRRQNASRRPPHGARPPLRAAPPAGRSAGLRRYRQARRPHSRPCDAAHEPPQPRARHSGGTSISPAHSRRPRSRYRARPPPSRPRPGKSSGPGSRSAPDGDSATRSEGVGGEAGRERRSLPAGRAPSRPHLVQRRVVPLQCAPSCTTPPMSRHCSRLCDGPQELVVWQQNQGPSGW